MFYRNSGFVKSMRPCTVEQNLPAKKLWLVKVWQKKIAQCVSKTHGWYFRIQSQQKIHHIKLCLKTANQTWLMQKKLRYNVTLDLPTAFWHWLLETSHAQCKTLGSMSGLNFWCWGQKIYLLEMENRTPCKRDCMSSLAHEIILPW